MPAADHLLLIDDDDATRELLGVLLAGEGWQVHPAADGHAALSALREGVLPAVVLCDMQMPGLCGPALAAAMRAVIAPRKGLSDGPVLVAMSATVHGAKVGGYDTILQKPFPPGAVRQAISGRRSAPPQRGGATTPAVPAAPDLLPELLGRLRRSMGADGARRLCAFALDDAEQRVQRMEEAAMGGDNVVYRREAHALKGSCGMIGAARLQALAAAAEVDGCSSTPLILWKLRADFRAALDALRSMLDSVPATEES